MPLHTSGMRKHQREQERRQRQEQREAERRQREEEQRKEELERQRKLEEERRKEEEERRRLEEERRKQEEERQRKIEEERKAHIDNAMNKRNKNSGQLLNVLNTTEIKKINDESVLAKLGFTIDRKASGLVTGTSAYYRATLKKGSETTEIQVKITTSTRLPKDLAAHFTSQAGKIIKFIGQEEVVKECQHLTRVFDFIVCQDKSYMFLEKFRMESLYHKVKPLAMNEAEAKTIGEQLAKAIDCLHSYGVCHLDIEPNRIAYNGGQIKLIDSKVYSLFWDPLQKQVKRLPAKLIRRMHAHHDKFNRKKASHVPPEIEKSDTFDGSAFDVWSFATVVCYLIFKKSPLDAGEAERLAKEKSTSRQLKALLQECLKSDPEKRLKSFDLLKASWFTEEGEFTDGEGGGEKIDVEPLEGGSEEAK